MESDDPFGSIVRMCRPTSSQEDVLQTCPFARESAIFDDESPSSAAAFGIPVDPTGIIMVSPPESSREQSPPHEEYQTPPEDSLPASSEEQRPQPTTVNTRIGGPFGEVDGGEVLSVRKACTDTDKAVDLGQDSDNLGFSAVKPTQCTDRGGEVSSADRSHGIDKVIANKVFERNLEKFKVFRRELSPARDDIAFKSAPKKLKVSDMNFIVSAPAKASAIDTEPLVIETFHDENANTEVLDLEVEEIIELGEDMVNVKLPLEETKSGAELGKIDELQKHGDRDSARKNVEDLDKFKYVSSGSINPNKNISANDGRRELPPSISGQANNAGTDASFKTSATKNQTLKDILDALKMLVWELEDGSEEEADFLETAKKLGMTLPRPRWWPADSYDD